MKKCVRIGKVITCSPRIAHIHCMRTCWFTINFFFKWKLSGHRHAMISLICMSTHKAMAARCLSLSPSHIRAIAIQALATATLRRLTLSVLFTIMTCSTTIVTNSYQTTCTVSERTFNKRQHANARHRVDLSLITHYDMVAAQT